MFLCGKEDPKLTLNNKLKQAIRKIIKPEQTNMNYRDNWHGGGISIVRAD